MVVSQSKAEISRLRAFSSAVQLKIGSNGMQRIAGKVHLRYQARGECRTEERKMNVRRSPGVVVIGPGICSRTNGDEAVAAFGVGDGLSASGEIWIEWGVMLIDCVQVAAGRIRLPDFEQRVRQGAIVFVEHTAAHDDSFAERFRGVLVRQIAGIRRDDFRFRMTVP